MKIDFVQGEDQDDQVESLQNDFEMNPPVLGYLHRSDEVSSDESELIFENELNFNV